MLKTKFIGKVSYKADEFHAAPGNTVFMSEEQWDKLGKDQALFEMVSAETKDFPTQSTRLPGWKEEGGEK